MAQIVSARVNPENGNYIIEVKPLDSPRLSQSGETVQTGGTNGWSEPLVGLTAKDPDGNQQPLTCAVQIRYKNPYQPGAKKKAKQPLTAEMLKEKAAKK